MKIAAITTLRGTTEDTLSFVHYHLNIGVDHLYLFFDNPDDSAIDLFKGYDNVTCTSCTNQHWNKVGCHSKSSIETRQTHNADLALKWCREADIDWVTHIDIDELIYTENCNIKEILSSIDNDASFLVMPPLEAIPTEVDCKNPYKELNNFKTLITDKEELELLPNKEELLYHGEFFRGHIGGKSFTKIKNNISLNIHKPSSTKKEILIEGRHANIFLLHYDCYNYKNWLTKWERRFDGTAKFFGRENRNRQFAEFCSLFEINNIKKLKELYSQRYLISSDTIALLKEKNAVRTISINPGLFKKP